MLNKCKIVIASVSGLASCVRITPRAAVVALVHPPVVPAMHDGTIGMVEKLAKSNTYLSLSHTSPYGPTSLAIFHEVTPLGESSVPWTKTATNPSASANKWNWDSVSIWL